MLNPNFSSTSYFRGRRWKLFLQFIPVIIIVIISLVGIYQLPIVRQFLGHAAGEPANLTIDTQAIIGPMPRPWENLAQGGEFPNWRLQPLIGSVKALHPQYIRIDHVFDQYDIVHGTPGNLTFDFSKLDPLLDDIQAAGAKPYIALSYMPPVISSGDVLAKPVRWEDWQLTIQKTVEHISGQRGTADVYYEIWNEPDLYGNWKYSGDKNYITLYTYAVRGAQNARGVQPFKIGGPAITALYKNWFDAMAQNSLNNNVRMDFFSWHRYTKDLDQYKKDMYDARTWLANYPQLQGNLELHITEWGHDSNVNPGYDTAYGAAHTVAASIQMIGIVERAFVFEIQDGHDPKGQKYWGRWGMFTAPDQGAAAKPRYNALRLLDRIASSQRLQTLGQGTWVKGQGALDSDGNVQVVLANFDPQSSHAEEVPLTFQNIGPGNFTITKELLSGSKQTVQVATDAATLRTMFVMPVNSVGYVTVKKQ